MTFKENFKLFYRIFTTPALLKLFLRGLYNIIKRSILEKINGKCAIVVDKQSEEVAKKTDEEQETIEQFLEKYANKNCHKCMGRGYVGIFKSLTKNENDDGKYIPCRCFVKNHNKYIDQKRAEERNKLKN